MQLEFDINLFFLTAFWQEYNNEERHASMQEFKLYLETKGSVHSQNTEFLAYYALPYVTKPNEHPIYQQLFEETWRNSVILRLSKYIDSIIQPNGGKIPSLLSLVAKPNVKQDHLMRQLTNELSDAEKRAAQSQKRLFRLQMDYQTLMSVTADILDALENTVKGKSLDSSVMQKIYSRLVQSQHHSSLRANQLNGQCNKISNGNFGCETKDTRFGEEKFEASGHKSNTNFGFDWNETTLNPLFELNYEKIKEDIQSMSDRKKCYLLQALRWRLTKSKVLQREHCLTSFVRNDILDLTTIGSVKDLDAKHTPLLYCLKSKHHRVREYMARFINSLASLCRGRAYLSQNNLVIELLIDEVRKEQDECITRENFVGALQKMSLRRPMQTVMIKQGVILWVINLLENMNNLSDYTLEYAVALCMNLCLRNSGKQCCIPITGRLLNVLMDLLSTDNNDIIPYINGALYSILSLAEIRKTAEKMNLKHILKKFIKPNQPEINRQFEFILQRLNSSEQPPLVDSDDDIDDEDDEEDASVLEAELDLQDLPPPDSNDLMILTGSQTNNQDPYLWVGEGLLKHNYAAKTVTKNDTNNNCADWCKSIWNGDNETTMSNNISRNDLPLQRPTTPSQRSTRNSISENHPSVGSRNQLYNSSLINHEFDDACNQQNLRDSLATITQSFTDEITPRATESDEKLTSSNNHHNNNNNLNNNSNNNDNNNNHDSLKESSTEKSNGQNKKQILISRQEEQGIFQSRPKIPRTPDTTPPPGNKSFTINNHKNMYNNMNDEDANSLISARQSPDSTVSSSTHNRYDDKSTMNSNRLLIHTTTNTNEMVSHYTDHVNNRQRINKNGTSMNRT
ncbi:unnamed protein product [Schistosoma turkestanicum]|nr:unnamed protein product [Schistosoma turkestanicum]